MNNLNTLDEWKDKTFVISTNNTSLFKYADRIVVMEAGRIGFMGTHEELMKAKAFSDLITNLEKAREFELDQEARRPSMEEKPTQKVITQFYSNTQDIDSIFNSLYILIFLNLF